MSQILHDSYTPLTHTQSWSTPIGTTFPYYAPLLHTSRRILYVHFPSLLEFPTVSTPNLNTITQALNLPPLYKEAMINNIQAQITLMQ